jgi:hypothetical protein
LLGSLPKKFFTVSTTFGILVIPPTRITSPISPAERPASLRAVLHGSIVLSINSPQRDSNFALVSLIFKCFGPVLSAVIKGKFTSVCVEEDSSILAFSAASLNLCNANLSCLRSIALSFLNSLAR